MTALHPEPARAIPFERYLQVRSALQPSFSPDGSRLSFLTNITGENQLWTVASRGGWPEQVTFGPERVLRAQYSPVRDTLAFSRDSGGNENSQIYLIQADGTGERRLTFDDGAIHVLGAWSPDGSQIAYACNHRERGLYDLWLVDVESGHTRIVWQNETPGSLIPHGFSPDGRSMLVCFSRGSMDQDIYLVRFDPGELRLLTPHVGPMRHAAPVFDREGAAIYCLSDRDSEFAGVIRIELASLARTPVFLPALEVDFLSRSPDGAYLAWATNQDGAHRLSCLDLASGRTREAPALAPGVISPRDLTPPVFAPDGKRLAFAYSSACRPADVWVWDVEAASLETVTHSSRGGIPDQAPVDPILIRYRSFDGLEIPGWYFRPALAGRRMPVVVYAHGGPESQTQPMYLPELQTLLAQGYAVLAPNVRGSTGYGKGYAQLDDVERRPDAVADLAYAAGWLKQRPEIDAGRIVVYGGSYGGFMVLASLVRDPELWAAGVEICGIANFVTFLERTGPYRRAVREAEYGSLERDRAVLEHLSPIHGVDRIRAPLLVLHGANDPRVPVGEAEQIAAALKRRRVPVELVIYPDEGHGLVRLPNRLDAMRRILAFLDGALGTSGAGEGGG